MNRKIIWRETLIQIAGMVVCLLAVTAAAYLWQAVRKRTILITYSISLLLMFLGAWIIFRGIVRRGYKQNGRLTPLPFFLQILAWGLFFAFPCIYNPMGWALSAARWSGWASPAPSVKRDAAWNPADRSFTRNPQLMGGALLVVGYILLWPSWYALGWLALFATMAHLMILAEEEYLFSIYGEEYERYCKRVPRYFGFPKN